MDVYYGLLSRLFLAPGESAFAAKALKQLYTQLNDENRQKALADIKRIIKSNKELFWKILRTEILPVLNFLNFWNSFWKFSNIKKGTIAKRTTQRKITQWEGDAWVEGAF